MARALVLVVCVLAGCGEGLGPPRVRPAPTPDTQPALRVPGPRSPRAANYRIDARYDAAAHTITATETLTWRNDSGVAADALPFHLYLNALQERDDAVHDGRRAAPIRGNQAARSTAGAGSSSSSRAGRRPPS
jgi:hypothetical protein